MSIGEMYLQWRILIAALFSALLPAWGGMMPLNPVATKTDFGFYAGGTNLAITASGVVSLDGAGNIDTNPDGSLAVIPSPSCSSCWAPGYQYFIPPGMGGSPYPTAMGGDGVNHFAGGGGNWDLYPSAGNNPWALEGAITTDTTNPNAIRFGAIAGTWKASPVANSADWFLVGSGGNFIVPVGGAHLYLIVVDTYYPNDTGSYTVTVTPAPEPSASWLVFAGLLLLAAFTATVRRMKFANGTR